MKRKNTNKPQKLHTFWQEYAQQQQQQQQKPQQNSNEQKNPYEKCWWSQFYQCWSPNKKKDDTTFECSSCNYKLANRIEAILPPSMYRHVQINLKLLQIRIKSRTFLHRIRFSYGPGQFRALSIHKSSNWKRAVTFLLKF